jgi:hypothetical protein
MDDRNPYAPSRASLEADNSTRPGHRLSESVWREGKVLIMVPDSTLPDRCVKCNQPADEPTKARKVYWHHPAVYLLVLINVLLYAIVGVIVRRRAVVAPGLCAEHKKRRRMAILLGWVGFITGIALLTWGFRDSTVGGGQFLVTGILLVLLSILASIILARIVYAQKIDRSYVRLKGCGPEFLDTLPRFPG